MYPTNWYGVQQVWKGNQDKKERSDWFRKYFHSSVKFLISLLCVFLCLTLISWQLFGWAQLRSHLAATEKWSFMTKQALPLVSQLNPWSSVSFSNLFLIPINNFNIIDTGTCRMYLIGRWITMSNNYRWFCVL